MNFSKTLIISTALLSAGAAWADSHQRNKYKLTHHKGAIQVDGVMDEEAWQHATKLELAYENNPGEGTAAPVKTEIFFFEDGNAFNVAIKAYDPDPSLIRASLRDRDALWSDDNVGIIIDTFNDERGAYEFFVNPLGAQADMKMDDTNGWNEDDSWDAIWDSAGKITDFGYLVEMSIPFSALRFPDVDGPLIWNVAGWRNYPRDVRVQMATHKSDRNVECNLCQFEQLEGFDNVESGNHFQLTPTLTVSRADEKPDVPGDWQEGDVDVEPGLDVRWGITQDMVLNATINPDFSQVEADAGQLDVNSTFSLFFPEKRPFFLDGASYFDTNSFNFVHTRNIADPDAGLKLTGKSGEHSYGVMLANDNNTSFLIPGNQGSDLAEVDDESKIAIARYKVDVGERNNIGILTTHRSASGYDNTLLSVDGSYWFSSADKLSYHIARSDTSNPEDLVEEYKEDDGHYVEDEQVGNALSLNYSHSNRDYNFRTGYTRVDEKFRADLGFNSRVDYEKAVIGGRRTWYGEKDDWLTRWGVFGDIDQTRDMDGKTLEKEAEIHGNLQGQKQFFTNFGVVHRERYYDGEYFDETQFMMFAEFTPISGLKFQNFFRVGDQVDFANTQLGSIFLDEAGVIWDVNQHLNLNVSYNYTKLDVDEGTLFTANQVDFRLGYQFDMRSKLKVVVQYTDIDNNQSLFEEEVDSQARYFSTQLIYSYKINPQTLFFIGYSDGGYQDDLLDSLERDQRTFFTKFSYAWQL